MSGRPLPANALLAGLEIAEAFEARSIPYALGGALAYGVWAVPRGTVDVDINVFVRPDELGPTFDALRDVGLALDPEAMQERAERDGMFVAHWGPWRIDLFTASVDFAWRAAETRVQVTVEGRRVWFLSAESLAVFKLLFFRGKDLVDLERLLATRAPTFDHAWVREHVVAMMGEDDARVREWDSLVARFAG